jgi:type II secretory pathway pseudopilin PulG
MDTDKELTARRARNHEAAVHTPQEELMSDKATMLQETDEAFADLRAMLDWLTEEQASRVWPVVRDSLNQIREHPVQNRDWRAARSSQTAESTRAARSLWAPSSFWGLRYPSKGGGNNAGRPSVSESPS